MESELLYIARKLFQLEIHKSSGQEFENFFSKIMGLSNKNFRPVKPQGNLGDRKNDGFDYSKGVYYQVYAPENLQQKQWESLQKLKKDFAGLYSFWEKISKIQEFYYVLNDRYKGAYPTTESALSDLRKEYTGKKFDLFLAKHLEEVFISLPENDIINVIGIIPSPKKIEPLIGSYSILKEVVEFILSDEEPTDFSDTFPDIDFDKKIKFNNLSNTVSALLIKGSYQAHVVDDYFNLNSNFAKQELQKKFKKFYNDSKKQFNCPNQADILFFDILKKATPKKDDKFVQDAVLVLMAYFFEACDIFEEPK